MTEDRKSTSVYVSIGRNVGAEPMAKTQWDSFRGDVKHVLIGYGLQLVSDTVGDGFWADSHEDAAVIVAAGDLSAWGLEQNQRALEDRIAVLAKSYGQDAIAVAYAEPRFVNAREA